MLCDIHKDVRDVERLLLGFARLNSFRLTVDLAISYRDLRSTMVAVPYIAIHRDIPFDRWFNRSRVEGTA